MRTKLHVKKGDKVKVLWGDDKGREGKVIKVFYKTGRVLVERVNMVKQYVRARRGESRGNIIEKEAPISAAAVMVICPNCDKPTRIKKDYLQDGTKVRKCKKCNEVIDKKYGT